MPIAAAVVPLLAATVAPSVEALPQAGPRFALTFDAHAESAGTRELLALLRERRIAATLFVTGRFAERFPAILREAAADGHEIGNHTYSHPHLTTWAAERRHRTAPGIDRSALHGELQRTAQAIASATGSRPAPLWRAPYGEHNAQIRAWAAELGYLHVDWTRAPGDALDALDWVEDPRQRRYLGAEAMARRLLSFERRTGVPLAGGIVLMHLGSPRADHPLLEALPILLDETDRRGLRPVPVSELIRLSGSAEFAAALQAIEKGGEERSGTRGLP
ncbi:MAG: polysaccharide deacetylase family protein [Acidobacteriota bacterium]